MTTPQFFAFDNMEKYEDGPISSFGGWVVWAEAGTLTENPLLWPRDNLESYSDGSITLFTGGLQWAADGTLTHY